MLMGSLGKTVEKQDRSDARLALLTGLFAIADEIFPDIDFRIEKDHLSFHAQACLLGGRKVVSLLGGLAFHADLKKDGILLVLLHEIGHHAADGPRQTATDWLSCDCAADRWAIEKGRPLFASHGYILDARSAVRQIELALSRLSPAYNLRADRFCSDWARRKAALTSAACPRIDVCEFANLAAKREKISGRIHSK